MPNKSVTYDKNQRKVITFGEGPLWVIAGPGSGKTDSIVMRCIKLLVVDRVPPSAIILTTFTEKAANNLQDRITRYMQHLIKEVDNSLADIDYTRVRIGTLHSLCNDIMQEFRFAGYQNYRLLDDLEQRLFIMEHSSGAAIDSKQYSKFSEIWKEFPEAFEGYDAVTGARWSAGTKYPPNRYARSRGLSILFNRVVEDMVDLTKMRTSGGGWSALADAYEEYRNSLFEHYRCDFAHIQLKFLDFLSSPQSTLMRVGNNTKQYPGIRYVLVDEYQDTNRIQEEVYFRLSDQNKNLCVVGDDDQAIYRFRGGTVECMINFGNTCSERWKVDSVETVFLSVNYRSHPSIVDFCDGYINAFSQMQQPSVRVAGKPKLSTGSQIAGEYPAVSIHKESSLDDLATFFADIVVELRSKGNITDYSQCVLLLNSTRRSKHNAGPFMDALERKGVPCYNPRSRTLLDEEEVMTVLGGFLEIIDPDKAAQNALKLEKIRDLADNWRKAFKNISTCNPDLQSYVRNYAEKIMIKGANSSVGFNLLEVFYHILNYPPLSDWIDDPNKAAHLGVITKVLDAYSNVPSSGNPNTMLGFLYTSSIPKKGISFNWRKSFYYSLMGLLASEGVNEAEDEIESFPSGSVPIMTIHQSKGLQFPFVFIYGLSNKNKDNLSVILGEKFSRFSNRTQILAGTTATDKSLEDKIRLYYVAYSRSQYALILLSLSKEYSKPGIGFGGSSKWTVFRYAKEI